jgi:uncharacterized membrane protein
MSTGEWILFCALILVLVLIIYYIFKDKTEEDEKVEKVYSIQFLCSEIKKL